ncbi:MAG: hypothetical protein K2H09_07910 [Treponemataceae bacterium]|nr:hypothetical protein [Treponemataceae bacterium]
MTIASWPSALKIPMLGGLNGQYQNPVVRTEMDAGPAKQRLRYTAVPKRFSGRLILTEEDRTIFEAFWKDAIAYGTLRFAMKNPQTGKVEEFRFTDTYTEDGNDDGLWELTLPLERLA